MNSQPKPLLRPYQIDDLAFCIANDRVGLLHDPGGGKTPPVCIYMYYLWKELGVKSVWTMPKSLLGKNVEELLRFSHFEPEDVYRVPSNGVFEDPLAALIARLMFTSTTVKDAKAKKLFLELQERGFIDNAEKPTEVYPEGIEYLRQHPPCPEFLRAKVLLVTFSRFATEWGIYKAFHPEIDAMVGDEWHLGYSSHKSDRTQQLYAFMEKTKRLVAMTGTMIKGRLTSAYPWIHLVEPNYYFNLKDFENQHEMRDAYGKRIGWMNHEKLGQIFLRHARRRSFEEIYGKESKVIQIERVEMADKQREAYKKFEAEAMLELEDSFLDGSLPGVHAIRCRQIMAHPETFAIMKGDTGKDERLRVHLEDHLESGEPLTIFAALQPEQERIYEMVKSMGFTCALINGNVSDVKRDEIDKAFRAREIQVLVGSAATAGVGFNWQHVNHVIFASLDYGDDSFVQAYRRFIRGTRETPLLITVLEYKNSIDQRIFFIVERKSRDANSVDKSYKAITLQSGGEELAA